MRGIARSGLMILLGCVPVQGYSDELPPFEGQTIADAAVKQQVIQTISIIRKTKFSCAAIDGISAVPLSLRDAQLHVPKWMHLPLKGLETATYERWTITGCSKRQSFVLTFWNNNGSVKFMTTTEKLSDS